MTSATASSTPRIPRDQWAEHPNYPEQVLLLGSHENFRKVSQYLIEEATRADEVRGIASLFRRWISAMRSHEGYEEHKLYPFLQRRFGVSCEDATAGHEELHAVGDEVEAALTDAEQELDLRRRAVLLNALERHDEALDRHLDLEENLVIPLLLELKRSEFEEYYYLPIEVLLRRLGEQSPSDPAHAHA